MVSGFHGHGYAKWLQGGSLSRDEFEQEERYDPNRIYSGGAKDEQGHFTNLRCAIPDPWAGAIAELVASSDWPEYTTLQTFIRDAVYHRLRWATNQKQRHHSAHVQNLKKRLRLDQKLDAQTMEREHYRTLLEKIQKNCRDAINDGNPDFVVELIESFKDQIDIFPEPYGSKLMNELEFWGRKASEISWQPGAR